MDTEFLIKRVKELLELKNQVLEAGDSFELYYPEDSKELDILLQYVNEDEDLE